MGHYYDALKGSAVHGPLHQIRWLGTTILENNALAARLHEMRAAATAPAPEGVSSAPRRTYIAPRPKRVYAHRHGGSEEVPPHLAPAHPPAADAAPAEPAGNADSMVEPRAQ